MEQQKYIIASWKMYGSKAQLEAFCATMQGEVFSYQVGVAPEFPFLPLLREKMPTEFTLVAQNLASEESGAYTGEVSARTLHEVGVRWVIIGHSERRTLFAESDTIVQKKLLCAIKAGLRAIICVDDSFEAQLAALPEALRPGEYFIAYEPVSAIGTGEALSLELIEEKLTQIKAILEKRYGKAAPIFYGGSVNGENAQSILALASCDGVLVGGASLDGDSFLRIAR